MNPPRLCYLVTHPVTARLLLRGQLARMREYGFDVSVISSPGPELDEVREREGVRTFGVPMSRSVRLQEGPAALAQIIAILRQIRPDIVNASTPKAGLLGMLASRALSVPVRIYLLRGLRLETERGTRRAILGTAERLAAACAHRVVCVSESLRALYVRSGYVASDRTQVLAGNGVDPERFGTRLETHAARELVRTRMGIPRDAPVLGYVGRLVSDKGLNDVLLIHEHLSRIVPDLHLMIVGGDLAGDAVTPEVVARLRALPRVVLVGKVDDTAPCYAAMDVLLFPSLREGLPNVVLEAAASQVPVVGYRTTGVVDAVADGCTGILVPQGDSARLIAAVALYLGDEGLRRAHGEAGRAHVLRHFTHEETWRAWGAVYAELLAERGLCVPPQCPTSRP